MCERERLVVNECLCVAPGNLTHTHTHTHTLLLCPPLPPRVCSFACEQQVGKFSFTRVFKESITQRDFFRNTTLPMLQVCAHNPIVSLLVEGCGVFVSSLCSVCVQFVFQLAVHERGLRVILNLGLCLVLYPAVCSPVSPVYLRRAHRSCSPARTA